MYKKQKGFTLVEMIIVTVIIGILAGIVITVINIPRVQARSRDSKRIGDLRMIQNSLELYFADNRAYPSQVSWVLLNAITDLSNPTDFSPYISTLPVDPRSNTIADIGCFLSRTAAEINEYGYYYRSNSSGTYVLGFITEVLDAADEHRSCTFTDTPNCGTVTPSYECDGRSRCYCVQNPM